MILGVIASAVVIALVAVSFQSKVYAARSTVLAPKESAPQGLSASLGALLGGGGGRDGGGGMSLPSLFGSGPSVATNTDMFGAILRSRTSLSEVSAELAKKYGPDTGSKLLSVDVSTAEKGVIAVSVQSTDPVLAAEAANGFFQVLDRTLERLAEQGASRQEKFYTDQIQRAAREVASAEEAVVNFQAENRVIPVDGPTKAVVDPNANLRGAIMAVELQREVMRMRYTEQHPQMRELDKQIGELKKQYSKNLFGAPMDLPGETPAQRRKEFFVSTEKLTPVQFAYLRLYRNLKIQEAFYTGALQGLEQLKYGDAHPVRVEPLDPALPPGAPVRPRVVFTVAVAAVGGLLVAIVLVSMSEYIRRLRAEERAMRARATRVGQREAPGPRPAPDDVLLEEDPFSVAGRSRH